MRTLIQRYALLQFLGELFRGISSETPAEYSLEAKQLDSELKAINHLNPWFTPESVYQAIAIWGQSLSHDNILSWASKYKLPDHVESPKTVIVIMAGNIPLVGFHDLLCTILSGHRFLGKLSSRDNILFPRIYKWILKFDPDWKDYIQFSTNLPTDPGVIIATGSNNTSRLISQKFAEIPMIIRHNRNSIGILTGNETESELLGLSDDILMYYGLGCRNVSMILLPEGADFTPLISIIKKKGMSLPLPYEHNLKYQRAKSSMHDVPFIDAHKILFIEKLELNSPLGVISFAYYKKPEEVELFRNKYSDQIQISIGDPSLWINTIPFGRSQKPTLFDYADGLDTLKFLINLS